MSKFWKQVGRIIAVGICVCTISSATHPKANATCIFHGYVNNYKAGVQEAFYQLGKPYSFGAAGPNAFDCSGLPWYAYRKHSGDMGPEHSSCVIAEYMFTNFMGTVASNVTRGDLIFYDLSSRNDDQFRKIDHVSIFIGFHLENMQILEARPDHKVSTYNRRNASKEVFWAKAIW